MSTFETAIPDFYQVKWKQGCWHYGIVDRWGEESKQYYENEQCVIVEDAIKPTRCVVKVAALVSIDAKYSPPDEYAAFVAEQYQNAKRHSDALPAGVHKGKLFRVPAGDGYAYYIATKVNKKTVDIEWRGYCLDRWVDARFGYGSREKREVIDMFVRREDGIKNLFSSCAAQPATAATNNG